MLKNFTYIILFIVLFLVLSACNKESNSSISETEDVLKEWLNKTIEINASVGYFTTKGDTIPQPQDTNFKIVRYIGSEGCTTCNLHLHRYKQILKDLSDTSGSEVGFLCIVNPSDLNQLQRVLKRQNLGKLPIFIDLTDSINKLNNFPKQNELRTFLVDGDNRVIAVGDPAKNPRVKKYFLHLLSNDSIRKESISTNTIPTAIVSNDTVTPSNKTTAEGNLALARLIMYPAEMELGTVHVGDTIVQEFNVTNISGNKCVLALEPTCDCISATLKPSNVIEPHESYKLEVRFIAKDPKPKFKCKINFVGNIEFQPFFLKITGNIIE